MHGAYIYFSNINDSPDGGIGAVTYCKVNLTAAGGVTDCQPALMDLVTDPPTDLEAITLNPAGTYAYLMQPPKTRILVCAINPSSAALENCQPTAENEVTQSSLGGVVFSTDGQRAYFGNGDVVVYMCDVKQDGTLSDCVDSGAEDTIRGTGIAFLHYPK